MVAVVVVEVPELEVAVMMPALAVGDDLVSVHVIVVGREEHVQHPVVRVHDGPRLDLDRPLELDVRIVSFHGDLVVQAILVAGRNANIEVPGLAIVGDVRGSGS